MNLEEYIQRQINTTHRLWAAMLQDLTEEQFNWTPSGTGNSIAATALHAFGIEDLFIHSKLVGQPLLWKSQGWAEKIALEAIPDLDNGWAGMRGRALDKTLVTEYGQAVHASADLYIAKLTSRDLAREVQMGPNKRPATDLLSTLVIHNLSHSGEVAALKGLQGLKGQPV